MFFIMVAFVVFSIMVTFVMFFIMVTFVVFFIMVTFVMLFIMVTFVMFFIVWLFSAMAAPRERTRRTEKSTKAVLFTFFIFHTPFLITATSMHFRIINFSLIFHGYKQIFQATVGLTLFIKDDSCPRASIAYNPSGRYGCRNIRNLRPEMTPKLFYKIYP